MSKTILQIIPRMGAGGAEQACVDLAAALKRRGDTALVASGGGARVAEIESVGGEHITGPFFSKNPATLHANARALARLIRERGIDLVHARSRAPAWSAFLACRWTGRPFVTTFHAAYAFSNPLKKFYNGVMARADRVIAISEFIADHIRASYGVGDDRLRIVPRGIDLERFTPARINMERRAALRQAWGLAEGQKTILLPARLSPIKGQAIVIRAMASVSAAARLVIVGDDQGREGYRRELDALIDSLELQGRATIVPHCADMPTAYALADLVAVPSQVPEGFGRVPVEAMAMGVPVLVSDLGALRETVQDGVTGWRVPPDSSDSWAQAMETALAMPEAARQAMVAHGQQVVQKRYAVGQMVATTLSIYTELL